jgi:hypothetical protein
VWRKRGYMKEEAKSMCTLLQMKKRKGKEHQKSVRVKRKVDVSESSRSRNSSLVTRKTLYFKK